MTNQASARYKDLMKPTILGHLLMVAILNMQPDMVTEIRRSLTQIMSKPRQRAFQNPTQPIENSENIKKHLDKNSKLVYF